ncbi:MAG: hypothetical protein PVF70_03735, partial [Anaerolineales bacterium]
MDIENKNVLVLGGYGLVGMAVCRALIPHRPACIVVASLRKEESEAAAERLRGDFPKTPTKILPAWGDILLRAE